MQVILTPTAVPNMFGPGLNGFKGSNPPIPPPTQFSAEWFNSVQMEIVNVILGQGLTLDGLQFNQMQQAFDNYVFANPAIDGTLKIRDGATLLVESGGALQCEPGSIVIFDTLQANGLATLQSLTVTPGLTSLAGVTASGLLTATGGLSLPSGADIVGSPGSVASLETLDTGTSGNVKAGDLSLYDRGASYSPVAGRLRWDGFSVMVGDGSKTRAIAAPIRSFDATFTGSNSIANTDAVVSVRLAGNAKVVISISWSALLANGSANCNYRLEISGIFGTAEPDIYSYFMAAPAVGYSFTRVFEWVPTDTWPAAVGPETYAFRVRLGRSGAGPNDLTATAIAITAERDTVV